MPPPFQGHVGVPTHGAEEAVLGSRSQPQAGLPVGVILPGVICLVVHPSRPGPLPRGSPDHSSLLAFSLQQRLF